MMNNNNNNDNDSNSNSSNSNNNDMAAIDGDKSRRDYIDYRLLSKKQKKLIEKQNKLAEEQRKVWLELKDEEEKQLQKQLKSPEKYNKKVQKLDQAHNKLVEYERNRGKGLAVFGQVFMVIGALISIGGFLLGGGWGTFVIGLILSLIGYAAYREGNKQQGKETNGMFFIGGFSR